MTWHHGLHANVGREIMCEITVTGLAHTLFTHTKGIAPNLFLIRKGVPRTEILLDL